MNQLIINNINIDTKKTKSKMNYYIKYRLCNIIMIYFLKVKFYDVSAHMLWFFYNIYFLLYKYVVTIM